MFMYFLIYFPHDCTNPCHRLSVGAGSGSLTPPLLGFRDVTWRSPGWNKTSWEIWWLWCLRTDQCASAVSTLSTTTAPKITSIMSKYVKIHQIHELEAKYYIYEVCLWSLGNNQNTSKPPNSSWSSKCCPDAWPKRRERDASPRPAKDFFEESISRGEALNTWGGMIKTIGDF